MAGRLRRPFIRFARSRTLAFGGTPTILMMHCPLDGIPLRAARTEGAAYHACRQCGGLWFAPTVLAHVSAAISAAGSAASSAASAPQLPTALRALPVPTTRPTYVALPCADCHGQLVPRRLAGVEIDVCGQCSGLWLDSGEFAAAHAALAAWHATAEGLAGASLPGSPAPVAHAQAVPRPADRPRPPGPLSTRGASMGTSSSSEKESVATDAATWVLLAALSVLAGEAAGSDGPSASDRTPFGGGGGFSGGGSSGAP